ncbi:MAG TPA: LptF/LptG family permease [Sedimentisphaerales bacterium]|jgi:lipopolysaccharide export LptBFGC system permease protein LptF|nr:LptF/LptG family permease [Sedimentisphaerales bacterium]HNU27643.1 LptF/LptG family permease [Sedimentisphaerales bacterium]
MVFTLQRYIFRELLRIFILAAVGLTLILSLGLGLSMSQEYGVGPRQTLHILVYVMPITLTFVLPMAALFSSALAYGRFASDNELDACRASGIGMMTLIYPGLTLAILVAIANLMLSFHVMPYFVHLAEKSLKADAKQILFRNIQRRGFYKVPTGGSDSYLIYADYPDLKNDTLYGIVVVEASREGTQNLFTSSKTVVTFDSQGQANAVRLAVYGCRQMGSGDDYWRSRVGSFSVRREIGPLLGDEIKFKKIEEMKRIAADLMRFDPVARDVQAVYVQYATELLARDVNDAFAAGRAYELRGPTQSIRLSAKGCELREPAMIALTPPVMVEERDHSGRLRRLRCEKTAEILVQTDGADPVLTVCLYNPQVTETGQSLVQYVVGDLAAPEKVRRGLIGPSRLDVARGDLAAALKGAPSPILARRQEDLLDTISETLTDIRAEVHSRLVFGIGCVPMILIGIGLGILHRGGHLLSAFGASCLPAAVLIVAIVSGKNLTVNLGAESFTGVLIMWVGLAFLLLLAAGIYGKLRRS